MSNNIGRELASPRDERIRNRSAAGVGRTILSMPQTCCYAIQHEGGLVAGAFDGGEDDWLHLWFPKVQRRAFNILTVWRFFRKQKA